MKKSQFKKILEQEHLTLCASSNECCRELLKITGIIVKEQDIHSSCVERFTEITKVIIDALMLINDGQTNSILKAFDHCMIPQIAPASELLYYITHLCYLMCFVIPDKKDKDTKEILTRNILLAWIRLMLSSGAELED